MNSKTTHTKALFGYRYSVARHCFISKETLGVDYTLSNCYQSFSVSFELYLSQNRFTLYCNSLLEGAIHFQQTQLNVRLHHPSVNDCEINVFRLR